jgi:hypothetical protein
MSKLLTAAQLMDARPPWQDVVCDAWDGLVRLARLSGPEKLKFALRASGLNRDGEKITLTDPHNWAWAVDLVAASVVNEEGELQFAGETQRSWLAGEIQAVSELLNPIMSLNGLGSADEQAEIEATKKD